jgi:hypothetical protein
MIYGAEAAGEGNPLESPPPLGPYTASAVAFDGATDLRLSSLTCIDNQFFGFAGWFQYDASGGGQGICWVADPLNNYNSDMGAAHFPRWAIGGNNGSSFLITSANTSVDATWHHFIGAGQTNFAAHSKIIKLFVDAVDFTANVNDNAASFNAQSNGLPFYVGSDAGVSGVSFYTGNMCDLSIWPGINLLTGGTISSTTTQLFRTVGGAPVNPTVAIAALGTPPIMLSGNAANFPNNTLGSSGAFTTNTGALTDAPTHP